MHNHTHDHRAARTYTVPAPSQYLHPHGTHVCGTVRKQGRGHELSHQAIGNTLFGEKEVRTGNATRSARQQQCQWHTAHGCQCQQVRTVRCQEAEATAPSDCLVGNGPWIPPPPHPPPPLPSRSDIGTMCNKDSNDPMLQHVIDRWTPTDKPTPFVDAETYLKQRKCGCTSPLLRYTYTRLVQPSLSIWFFLHKKKVGNFGEKPFVWEFLLGGDTSKKRIKNFTRKNHHGGSPAPPRVPDLVCKFSFAFPRFLVAVANLISFCRI